MLIDTPEPIVFDFAQRPKESMDTLAGEIMFTSGRAYYPYENPDGDLLVLLLHKGGIRVQAQKYALNKAAALEDHRQAEELASWIGKRNSGSLFHALPLFQGYEPLLQRNEYNALYYPALKAYVRFGDLHPEKLLAMLAEEHCDSVMLFRDCSDSSTEDTFFIFTLGIAKANYLALLQEEQERRFEELAQAVLAVDAGGIVPKVLFDSRD